MPADTSIGLSQETRDRLDDYRSPAHASLEEVIQGLMEVVPPAEDILAEDACAYSECDKTLWVPDKPEDRGGVIQWHAMEYDDSMVYGSSWFCSPEHAEKQQAEVEEMAAVEPDRIIVGGDEEMRIEVEMPDLRLRHPVEGDESREIGIDAPLDLVGETRHGHEYDYHGEPVYVENGGKVRFSGVVDDIIREEVHTAIIMGRDVPTEMMNHPNEERRTDWISSYTHWYDQSCPECGETVRVSEDMDDVVECPKCEAEVERDPVSMDDLPDPIREERQ